ncbi:MAG: hypothetical protein WC805_01390 [Patescibacteria group bacterium]|jgi:hypothetical protein
MNLTDKQIDEFQAIFKKEYGKEMPREEAVESAHNLMNLMEVLFKSAHAELTRQERLKKEPKGFHIEGGDYTCSICHATISNDQTWYDKFGIKCLICQRAVEQKKVPGSVCKNRDSWYSDWELKDYYGIHYSQAKKLIREGVLKARIIPGPEKKPYFHLYLLKDNPGVLQPKPKAVIQRVGERGITLSETPKLTLGQKPSQLAKIPS